MGRARASPQQTSMSAPVRHCRHASPYRLWERRCSPTARSREQQWATALSELRRGRDHARTARPHQDATLGRVDSDCSWPGTGHHDAGTAPAHGPFIWPNPRPSLLAAAAPVSRRREAQGYAEAVAG